MHRFGLTRDAAYVETPRGIFTASGVWFRTTEAALRSYAGPVLEREPLPRLLGGAEVWLRAPETLALWALPLLLLTLSPLPAALASLTVFAAIKTLGPAAVHPAVLSVLRVLDVVLVQALYFVLMLSMLAAQAEYAAVWTGLGGFVLLRWGLVARLLRPLTDRLQAQLYPLPEADQVLKALLLRTALRLRLPMPELDRMERQILDHLHRRS